MSFCRAYRFGALGAAALVLAGCYSYIPVEPATPAPGTFIRADVNDQAASRLTSTLGPGVLQLRGMVLDHTAQEISLTVDSYMTARSGELSGNNTPIHLSYGEIRQLEQKQLARGRSVVLGAAFVGGALLVTHIVASGGRLIEDENETDPPGTDRRRTRVILPFLRIRFP